jgi:hypothetical protein
MSRGRLPASFEAGDPRFGDYFWIFFGNKDISQQITPSFNLQQAEN